MSSLPSTHASEGNEWESALASAGCLDLFRQHHAEATAESVTRFLAFSEHNPSSIRQCLETARFNARAVRTALTVEMWETINGAWLEIQDSKPHALPFIDIPRFLDWVKEVSLRFDGSGYRTMLRNDAFYFSRLGIYLERADATARILDVKFHFLLPATSPVGGGVDYAQWSAILRAVSAAASYHWVYRESLKPWLIADLLILKEEMPRSLAACYANIITNLDHLAAAGGRQGAAQRRAHALYRKLRSENIAQIFQSGLHEFINGFIADNDGVNAAVVEQYLS